MHHLLEIIKLKLTKILSVNAYIGNEAHFAKVKQVISVSVAGHIKLN